jgi:hypothetical protein
VASLFLLLALNFIVQKTRIGKAMRAAAYDKPTARLMGINVNGIISITFAIGASLAGAGGMLYAIAYPSIVFWMGLIPGLKAFVAAVLGGIGSIPGALGGFTDHGTGRSAQRWLYLNPHARCHCLHDPDYRAPGKANRSVWRAISRKGLTLCLIKFPKVQ